MNYHVRRQGAELGTFSLEELKQRRASGELTGAEYVRCEGVFDWQPLDFLLERGPAAMPPPVVQKQYAKGPNQVVIWSLVGLASVVMVGGIAMGIYQGFKMVNEVRSRATTFGTPTVNTAAMDAASKPVTWTTNTLTANDVNKRAKEFRLRQWSQAYAEHGQHDKPWDADATLLFKAWSYENYGGTESNLPSSREMEERLAKDAGVDDPLVLTAMSANCGDVHEKMRLLERALPEYKAAGYHAYPEFYASLVLATESGNDAYRVRLEQEALGHFKKCFADGSFISKDQPEVAEILLSGWASGFFNRHQSAVCNVVRAAGKNFAWLSLVLEGQQNIDEAWAARGNGYANTVTSQGWQGFNNHLSTARKKLTEAWNMRPDLPEAPERMIYVSLGDSDITEMRLWFDRATAAQIDYPGAWSQFRWGLRPRWNGDTQSMLALGVTAANTGRFDTDVPRMLYDAISDVESEMELAPGEHIYGREDVWPNLKKMYEGYIAQPGVYTKGWRSTYAVIAYYAGKYDVAREQFDALNWEPDTNNFLNWDRELTLLPLEIAARTGSSAETVERAEAKRSEGDTAAALALYQGIEKGTNADARTREFAQHRVAELQQEQRLQSGEWVDWLPKDEHDPNWVCLRGKVRVLPDGAVEVESGELGHMFYSRARVGAQFEIKGEFEVMRTSNKAFQAGIIMGLPDTEGYHWNSLRIIRRKNEGDQLNYAYHFSGNTRINVPVTIQNGKNSFSFRLENLKASATLNGVSLLQNANQPRTLNVNGDDYLVGLGGFHEYNETVIRYRNVQVRRLGTGQAAAK